MFRTIARVIRGHHFRLLLCDQSHLKVPQCLGSFILVKPNFSAVHHLGSRAVFQNTHAERDTLTYKVSEYFRTNEVYSAMASLEREQEPNLNAVNTKYAIRQLLLDISYGPRIAVNDILELFSLYASSNHDLTRDIISYGSMMKIVSMNIIRSFVYMELQDIEQLALSLGKIKTNKTFFMRDIINSFSNHCESLVSESDLSQSLKLFDILLIVHGNNLFLKSQFDTFISAFDANMDSAQVHDLVQMLHYNGLGKTTKLNVEFMEKAVLKLVKDFHKLSFCDAGIAVAGIFKVRVKTESLFLLLHAIAQHLQSGMKNSSLITDLERYSLIAMLKLLRYLQYKDNELLSVMNGFVLQSDYSLLNPQVVAHILAFYANSQVYHQELFTKLENVVLQQLGTSVNIRVTDLNRVLMSFSHVGHKSSTLFLEETVKYLTTSVNGTEITKRPYLLSHSLLSLAILGNYPSDLIKEAFKLHNVTGLKDHQRSRRLSKLLILNQCLQVEAPEVVVDVPTVLPEELPMRWISDEIRFRSGLARLMEGAQFINDVLGVQVLKLKFIIPYINLASLVVNFNVLKGVRPEDSEELVAQRFQILQQFSLLDKKLNGQRVAIECLESKFLLQESSQPVGLIRLKLRLLHQKGWTVKKMLGKDVEEYGNDPKAVAALIIDKLH